MKPVDTEKNEKTKPPDYVGHRRRLKERFRSQGLEGWYTYEVLELMLGYAIPRRDVKPVAKRLLERFPTLKEVLDAPLDRLQEVEGLGPQAALFLKLYREVLILYLEEPERRRRAVTSPEQIREFCRARLEGLPEERFLVIFLDNRHRLISSEIVHRGTVDMSIVYPREVMTRALLHRSAAIIVAHNHPGGSCTPSAEDIKITRELRNAAAALGIRLLDHLIVAGSRVISLRETGDM
ncbi:MAG: DNA repair protein RadC [Deltaproteobacteria bacterium]|nr:DNA repair protein RadC [Deltaproteobacteria bacterium]